MGGLTNNFNGATGSNHPSPADSTAPQVPAGGSAHWPTNAIEWARFIHRLLRGRYRLALIVVVAYAVIGAVGGWFFMPTYYRSDGMVRIASSLPAVIQDSDQTRTIPMFDSFMQAQQEMVISGGVMEEALKDTAWSAKAIRGKRLSVEELANQLKVEVKPKSENLRISYIDTNPALASTAVESTINAYRKIYNRDHLKLEQQRLQLLQDYRSSIMSQLGISDATTKPSDADAPATMSENTPTTQPFPMPGVGVATAAVPLMPTPEMIAMTDSDMRHFLDDQAEAQEDLDQATIVYGPRHVTVLRQKMALEAASRRVDQYLQEYIVLHQPAPPIAQIASINGAPTTQPTDPAQASASASAPSPMVAGQPALLTPAMQQLESRLEDVNRRIETLKAENSMPKRIEIVTLGELAVPVEDKRIKVSAISAGVSGIVAFILMTASGLIRRRYNFCAEVTDDFSQRTPFVAAIPELDAGDDLQSSEDAAQCIHHLREALKPSGKVFAFTCAGMGEGRTSVVLSLAMSFSATGARTLVIDSDILTRSLTKRFKLESAPGFFQAISTGNIDESLRFTRSGVNIMPIGNGMDCGALSIGEPALVGLLERLRERFDTILIDAGTLASVETCVVARQAEGIVLIVGRGQQQSTVRSGLTELEQLKLNVLGTVFNRAEKKDFYHSIHREPIPVNVTGPREVSEMLASCGPLVQAVGLSLRKDITILSPEEIAATQLNAA